MTNHPKVIIIGAGISGLSAANHLLRAGQIDVCILEGRNRVGGRMCTKRHGTETMELGAASIHGTEGNPIYDFACEHNLMQGLDPKIWSHSCDVGHVIFSACGEHVDKKLVEEVSEVYKHILERATEEPKMFMKLAEKSARPPNLGTYIQSEFQKYLDDCEDSNHRNVLREKLFVWLQRVECIFSGCQTLHDLNLEDFGEYTTLEGPIRCPVPAGYDTVTQILASNLPMNCICFDHIVHEIQWSKANGSSTEKNGMHPVQVVCKNGECFDADHVIITIPLGVLKLDHQTLFKPSLPREKVQAIEHLGFGICDKIFLEFEEPFWSGSQYRVNLVWTGTSAADTVAGIATDPYPVWVYKLFTFFTISPGSKILMTWIWGDAAIEMEETAPERVGKLCLAVLKQFTCIEPLPKLVSIHRTQWYTDPFSRGSYSYVATEARGKDIDMLASPLPCKEAVVDTGVPPLQLLFAGEAAHRHFYSTVHGAYVGGIREANRITAHLSEVKTTFNCS